jgi:cytochrome c-type biogenesis protein CcmH
MVGALVLLSLYTSQSAFGQQPVTNVEDEVLRISKNLYCPVCPATPLDVCETKACIQWRGLIKEKLLAGENEQQIRAYFIAQYGERVLGAPTPEGFNLGAYVLPALLLLAGGAVIFLTMRGWLSAKSQRTRLPTIDSVPPEYANRIAEALKESER